MADREDRGGASADSAYARLPPPPFRSPRRRNGEQPLRARATRRICCRIGPATPPPRRCFFLPLPPPPSPVEQFIHGAILAGQSAPKSAQLQDDTTTVFPHTRISPYMRFPHCARCLNEATSSRFFSLLLPPSPNLPRLESSRMPPPVTATATVTVKVTDRPRGGNGYFLLFVRDAL